MNKVIFFVWKTLKRVSLIWYIYQSKNSSYKGQLDTKLPLKKNTFQIGHLPLWSSIACRRMKNTSKTQQRKEHLQTPSPCKPLKAAKSTRRWQRDLKPIERTSAEATLQRIHVYNPLSSKQRIGDVKPCNRLNQKKRSRSPWRELTDCFPR
jgi:hypothetical protein